jgi:hypothetical protein
MTSCSRVAVEGIDEPLQCHFIRFSNWIDERKAATSTSKS